MGDAAHRCRLRTRRSFCALGRSCWPTGVVMPCPRSRTNAAQPWLWKTSRLFAPVYPNVILVPLTEDAALAIPDLIDRDRADRGERLHQTLLGGVAFRGHDLQGAPASDAIRVTVDQLAAIRRQIALAVGIEG